MKKLEILSAILAKLGLTEIPGHRSTGSTITRDSQMIILFKILENKSTLLKQDAFSKICSELGITVSSDMLSTGSTITKKGLEEILKKI